MSSKHTQAVKKNTAVEEKKFFFADWLLSKFQSNQLMK